MIKSLYGMGFDTPLEWKSVHTVGDQEIKE